MMETMRIVEEPKKPLSMHPKKFAMWLFLATVVMIFASMTSAYIVRRAEGDWKLFELPSLFYWTSIIIVASSVTMHLAYLNAKKNLLQKTQTWITATALLGLGFLVGQFYAWGQLVSSNVYFVGNPSESFVYVLSGLHGLHLVSAVIFLLIVWNSARLGKMGPKSLAQIEMCVTYWHFLGGLWLYLFVFLSYYR
ncbi:MAG: cytochrome c oxidase subunit 3 [Cyclobacteriaceae bacterium]